MVLEDFVSPMHVEIKNHLSLVARIGGEKLSKVPFRN